MSYPTKLRKGDHIEGDGWVFDWNGRAAFNGPNSRRSTKRSLRLMLVNTSLEDALYCCDGCAQLRCIIEQLVAEGAL